MKSLFLFAFIILASHIPAVSFAQGEPQATPQAITVLKRPQIPGNTIEEIVNAEPSKYGKFRLKNTKEDDNILIFDRTDHQKKESWSIEIDLNADWESSISEIGSVEFPFMTPTGEEFHLFQVVWMGSGATPSTYYVIVIDKDRAWAADIYISITFDPKTKREIAIEDAYISQQKEKTVLSLIVPPTTVSEGQTFLISMGSIETKRTPPLPRWAKSTRTFKMVGTFEAETDNARANLPCIAGKETSMDADIKAPTGDQEYCIQHMSTCEFPESPDGYGSVPAEMTLLETLWSDSTREYTCLYLKGL
jgi:hypothetical protein